MSNKIRVAEVEAVLRAKDEMSQHLDRNAQKIEHLGKKIEAIGKIAVLAGGALAALLVVDKIKGVFDSAVNSTVALGEDVFRLTKSFNMGAESASKWVFVAKHLGLETEQLTKGFKIFSKHLEETSLHMENKGTPSANVFGEELKKLGVKAFDSKGHIRTFDAVLLDVADSFAKLGPDANKAGIVMNLFGKSGMDMIPILSLGRKGIEELGAEAQKYGLIITEKNLPKIHEFVIKHRELDAAMEGLKLTIGTAVIPALSRMTEMTTGAVQSVRLFIESHPEVIAALQKLSLSGLGAVERAAQTLIEKITGGSGAKNAFEDLDNAAGDKGLAGALGDKGLAGTIVDLATKLGNFADSQDAAKFRRFWEHLDTTLAAVAGTLKVIGKVGDFIAEGNKRNEGRGPGGIIWRELTEPWGSPPPPRHGFHPFQAGSHGPLAQDMPAFLHRGEVVLSAAEVSRGRGGGAVTYAPAQTFHIYGVGSVDEVERRISVAIEQSHQDFRRMLRQSMLEIA
jgi:hypothetical protein